MRKVCEVGPGFGNVAIGINKLCSSPLYYAVVDISRVMLDRLNKQLASEKNPLVQFDFFRADFERKLPVELSGMQFDRLLAVNVMQDLNAEKALMNAAALLKPGGFLQATFIAKEFQDIFWRDDPSYDQTNGCWYAESRYHENKKCRPLGYRQIGTEKIPFFRKMSCYTREDVSNLMSRAGFTLQSIEPLIYPSDYVLERWSSKYHSMKINERQMELLHEWNGYKDGWSVKAVLTEPSPL